MAIEVADLVASLGVDSSKFDSGMAAAETRMKASSSTMRMSLSLVGQQSVGMGRDLLGALGAAINPAMAFEQTMSGVQAVSGATATQLKQLSGLALQLGKDTTFSAGQAGQGIEELIKGGISIQDVMGGAAKATLNLAAAGGVDLATAAEIAANAMNMFGINGKEMGRVSDMIAGAANASSLSVMDFRYSLAYAGNAAHAAGVSFDDLAVAIAELGQAGIKGSGAGTGLQDVLTRLAKPTGAAAVEMRKLGLITAEGKNQFFDAQGHLKRLADVQEILRKSTAGLTDQQRLADLQTIFGQRGMRTAIVLAGDGAAGFDKMAAAMGKVSAASVAQTRMGNLAGEMEQFNGSVETLAISLGLALMPRLTQLAKVGTEVVNALIDFTGKLPRGFVETAATLAGVAGAALTLGGTAALVVAAINPITLAIGGVLAAGALLFTAWQNDWGGIQEKIKAAWSVIGPILGNLGTALRTAFDFFTGNGAALMADFHGLPTAWRRSVATMLLAADDLRARLGATWDTISAHIGGAWSAIQPALRAIRGEFDLLAGVFKIGGIGLSWEVMQIQLRALVQNLGGWIRSVGAPALITHLQSWADAFWGWVQQAAPPLLREAGALATRLWTWLTTSGLPQLNLRLRMWGNAFWQWVGPAAVQLVNQLGPLLDRLGGWIGAQAPVLGAKLATWAGAFWGWVRHVGPPLERELARLATTLGVYAVGAAAKLAVWLVPRAVDLTLHFHQLLADLGAWILTTAVPQLVGFGNDMGAAMLQGILDAMKDLGPKVLKQLPGTFMPGVSLPFGIDPTSWFGGGARPAVAGVPAGTPGGQGGGHTAIHVYVTPNGATAMGGTEAHRELGTTLGNAVAHVMAQIDGAEKRAGMPARRMQPGARSA